MTLPMTPADADLQDFPFMPLQVARLRDSDLAAEEHPEACWYAVLLWSASWHQLPAGSLPDNDVVLMKLVGLGRDVKTWKKHKAGALRGFVLCDDGRLYHPVVAEQVAAAWKSKLEQRHRSYCATIRKHNQRHPDDQKEALDFEAWDAERRGVVPCDIPGVSHVTASNVPRDIGSKGQGQGQGQGQGDTNTDANASLVLSARERARRLPADWEPGPLPGTVASLVEIWPPGREQRELEGFRDYWAARSKDAAKLDWDKAWHNRIRDQHDRIIKENRNGNGHRNGGSSIPGLGRTEAAAVRFAFDQP